MPERDRLSTDFGRVFFRMHRFVDRRMAASGASLARTKLLMFLDKEGPSRASDIAEFFGLAPRTVTEGIDGLERDGLVRRNPDPGDRRAKLITITEAGRHAIAETEPLRQRLIGQIYGALTNEERKAFERILAKLSSALDEQEQGEEPDSMQSRA